MFKAFSRGFFQLGDGPTRRILLLAIGLAVVVFVGLWLSVAHILAHTALFQMAWLETAVDLLGGLATAILTWFLFPGAVSAVVALFLERIAACVEARHYPDLPPPESPRLADSVLSAIRFLAIFAVLNLALLPFLFFPPIFPFVFYGVNGYLLGREYFELVALRRFPPEQARALRKTRQGQVFVAGVIIAFLLTIPVVNLIMPVVATATIIHLFEGWRQMADTRKPAR